MYTRQISAKRRVLQRSRSARTVMCIRPMAWRWRARSAMPPILTAPIRRGRKHSMPMSGCVRNCRRRRQTLRFRRQRHTLVRFRRRSTTVQPTNTLVTADEHNSPADTVGYAGDCLSTTFKYESWRVVGGMGRARGNGARLSRELGEGGRGFSDLD